MPDQHLSPFSWAGTWKPAWGKFRDAFSTGSLPVGKATSVGCWAAGSRARLAMPPGAHVDEGDESFCREGVLGVESAGSWSCPVPEMRERASVWNAGRASRGEPRGGYG